MKDIFWTVCTTRNNVLIYPPVQFFWDALFVNSNPKGQEKVLVMLVSKSANFSKKIKCPTYLILKWLQPVTGAIKSSRPKGALLSQMLRIVLRGILSLPMEMRKWWLPSKRNSKAVTWANHMSSQQWLSLLHVSMLQLPQHDLDDWGFMLVRDFFFPDKIWATQEVKLLCYIQ